MVRQVHDSLVVVAVIGRGGRLRLLRRGGGAGPVVVGRRLTGAAAAVAAVLLRVLLCDHLEFWGNDHVIPIFR